VPGVAVVHSMPLVRACRAGTGASATPESKGVRRGLPGAVRVRYTEGEHGMPSSTGYVCKMALGSCVLWRHRSVWDLSSSQVPRMGVTDALPSVGLQHGSRSCRGGASNKVP
jgi:hypothetical protein